MYSEWINIALAFLEGLALILSPCILPILPIILSASIDGSKKRPLGIILGFVLSFSLFTFFSRQLVLYTGIDLMLIRYVSYGLLILLGVMMLSTRLSERFNIFTQRLTAVGSNLKNENGLWGGVIFGCLIGVIWTPCAGPILAAVIVQSILQQTSLSSFFTILFFGVGAAVPMFFIALFGRGILNQFGYLKKHTQQIRQILGAIIIAAVCYMIYAERYSTTASPQSLPLLNQNKIIKLIEKTYPAPAIEGATAWINSKPLLLEQLRGKVVLIDFWTYSCINCIRTFPYLKDWYAKYHDKGLIIIGVHAPEFEFEKNIDNVKSAVEKFGILYPVALDNHFTTWQNYANRYWPAHYLIDKNGYVVYKHFGEGEYDVTENNIRFLLGLTKRSKKSLNEEVNDNITHETYFGVARMQRFASQERVMEGVRSDYSYPVELPLHEWALKGSWRVELEKAIAVQANASVEIHFNAKNVFVVMGSASGITVNVKVLLNGNVIKEISVDKHQLYEALSFSNATNGVLELVALQPGLEIYTFTFG